MIGGDRAGEQEGLGCPAGVPGAPTLGLVVGLGGLQGSRVSATHRPRRPRRPAVVRRCLYPPFAAPAPEVTGPPWLVTLQLLGGGAKRWGLLSLGFKAMCQSEKDSPRYFELNGPRPPSRARPLPLGPPSHRVPRL